MLKLAGFICILSASALAAHGANRALLQRYRLLLGFSLAIRCIRTEIAFNAPPLQRIIHKLSGQEGVVSDFFSAMERRMSEMSEKTLSEVFMCCLNETPSLQLLRKEELTTLSELGNILGRYDIESNIAALSRTADLFDEYTASAKKHCERSSKIHMTLGLSSGLAIALLLL